MKEFWWARKDLNLRPTDYESARICIFPLYFCRFRSQTGPITMRPRHQQGQICVRGSNWILRYHEDRIVDGRVKRVRTMKVLAPYSTYPYKITETNSQLRSVLSEKINTILSAINGQGGTNADSTLTLGEFIEHRYFPRLDQRLKMPAGNELHIEPSTVKGYKD